MSTGDRQLASEWLPPELAAASEGEAADPSDRPPRVTEPENGRRDDDREGEVSASEDVAERQPEDERLGEEAPDEEIAQGEPDETAHEEPAADQMPEEEASKAEPPKIFDHEQSAISTAEEEPPPPESLEEEAGNAPVAEEVADNGRVREDDALDRLQERADRAKRALLGSETRGEESEHRVRTALADTALQQMQAAEARARDAAATAERLAQRVSELNERLAAQEAELQRLGAELPLGGEHDLGHQAVEEPAPEQASRAEEPEPPPLRKESDPAPQPEPPQPAPEPQRPAPSADLDLNRATFEQLCDFGLSVNQAARLIGQREQRGGFSSIDELDQLYGLPPEKIEALKQAAGA